MLSRRKIEFTQENITNKRNQIQEKKNLQVEGLKLCSKCKKPQDVKNFRKRSKHNYKFNINN